MQSQSAGQGAIAVQISGDGNSVTIGGERLAHNQLHLLRRPPETIVQLLRADLRATTLVGRADQCRMLEEWRAGDAAVAVKCIIGGAGAGKTRLAIEACEAAADDGWFATFVPSAELRRFHERNNMVHWDQPKDMLLVVDYAAMSSDVLKGWFAALAPKRKADGRKLRVLLLERHADQEQGWWADLRRPDSGDRDTAADLIGAEVPYTLPPLDAVKERRTILAEAMELAGPLFDPPRPATVPPAPGEDAQFDAQLADSRLDNEPLFLLMVGVRAVETGARGALAMTRLDLAAHLAGIEAARLTKFAKAKGFADEGALFRHLAACVTLQNGVPFPDLPALVREEREATQSPSHLSDKQIARLLSEFLPKDADKIAPVRPDLIGECLIVPELRGDRYRSDVERDVIALRAWRRDPGGTLDTLIRCARDLAEGSADHQAIAWLRAIVEQAEDVGALMQIADGLPEQTLAMREFAADVQGRIVTLFRASGIPELEALLGSGLNNLAIRLSYLGRREEALAAAREAASIHRTLAAARPDVFLPSLAVSLNNLANRLSDLGYREEALGTAQEAVSNYRALAANAAPFIRDLANSLDNLAARFSDLGRREEALATAQEAVSLHRTLAVACPDASMPDLAGSLNNLATFLRNLDRREEALAEAQGAVSIYRTLAAARPDAFLPDLAMSLNNLANNLSNVGSSQEALEIGQEAASIHRTLAAARPDAFMPDLAGSLNNLATFLSDLARREEALAVAQEAVSLQRTLAVARPDAFLPRLANSLSLCGDMLEAVGEVTRATDQDAEAVAILAPFVSALPLAFGEKMIAYVRDYLRRCEIADIEPDYEMLVPITEVLTAAGFFEGEE